MSDQWRILMKVICDLRDDQIKQIRRLIENGCSSDFDAFIQLSIDNQIKLESDEETDWSIIIQKIKTKKSQTKEIEASFDELKLNSSKNPLIIDPPKFGSVNTFKAKSEEDLWIWGQINKIFPIKFVVRLLLNKIPNGEKYISLTGFTDEVCKLAMQYGLFLLAKDTENKKERDERLSTAFPIRKNKEKAFSRFSSHFIGHKRTDDLISGALANMKFANINGDYGSELIGITKEGIEFSKIENHVIDKKEFKKSLSEEEVNFYLEHIRKNVLGEAKSMRLILNSIQGGITTRDEINKELRKNVPEKWSDKVVNTQRAGLMSRMYELGLINKKKKGIYVEYIITDKGNVFFQREKKT